MEFTLGEEIPATADAPITLLLAIFKFDRMEWAIEKCTELNVTTIVPVIARRTEKHLALAAEKRVERWRRIAREASEQSRRVAPPEIAEPRKLRDALILLHEPTLPHSTVIPTEGFSPSGGICGSPRGSLHGESPESDPRRDGIEPLGNEPRSGGIELSPGREALGRRPNRAESRSDGREGQRDCSSADRARRKRTRIATPRNPALPSDIASLALAVGPEGGWTDDELQGFASSRWIAASLGDTILRAETAAIAALAIARAEI